MICENLVPVCKECAHKWIILVDIICADGLTPDEITMCFDSEDEARAMYAQINKHNCFTSETGTVIKTRPRSTILLYPKGVAK